MGTDFSRCGCGYTSGGLRAVPRNNKKALEKKPRLVTLGDPDRQLTFQFATQHQDFLLHDSSERKSPPEVENIAPVLRHSKSMNDRRQVRPENRGRRNDVTVPVGMPVADYNKEIQTERAQSHRRGDGHFIAKSEGQSIVDGRSIQTCGVD